jgi:hypothetical protein
VDHPAEKEIGLRSISPCFSGFRRDAAAMTKKKRLKKEVPKSELATKSQARLAVALEQDTEFQQDMARQLDAFRKKFGRDPVPSDPLFFDPEKNDPTPISGDEQDAIVANLIQAMVKVGRPEFGYAYARSGYLVSEENHDLIPDEGLRAWDGAIREWFEMSAADRATAIQGLVSRRRQ